MTLEKAIQMLQTEYEKAQNLTFVRNPLAYALYKVWKVADRQNKAEERPGLGWK